MAFRGFILSRGNTEHVPGLCGGADGCIVFCGRNGCEAVVEVGTQGIKGCESCVCGCSIGQSLESGFPAWNPWGVAVFPKGTNVPFGNVFCGVKSLQSPYCPGAGAESFGGGGADGCIVFCGRNG